MRKSRDSRDVFAVFKRGSFMEGEPFSKKLKYWFKNVYWFHFKFATFAVIIAAILAGVLVYDLTHQKKNDLDYIVGGDVFANTTQMNELSDYFEKVLADGDKKASMKVGYQMLCTANSSDSTPSGMKDDLAYANANKIEVCMADNEVLLFLFDAEYVEWYAKNGAFEDLSEYGIESENPYYVRIDDSAIIKKVGINHNEDGLYAAIKVKNSERKEDARILEKYENAVKIVKALCEG